MTTPLYKISAFSRLGQVSIKALRLYDERGLLKPAQVAAQTGYRYYALEQLPQLHRILALKAMGFSLEQIGQLLQEGLSLSQMQTMLSIRQTELQQQLLGTQQRLSAVEAHLKHIESEKAMPQYDVVLKSVEPVASVMSIRQIIPAYPAVGELFSELMTHLTQHAPPHATQQSAPQPSPATPYCAAIWHDPGYKETHVDAEAIMAVPPTLPGNERIQIKALPAMETVAAVIHRGPYSTLNQPYAAIMQWIEDNGYEVTGPNREVYLRGGAEQNNTDYVTELQFPVKKVTA